jgi:tetratricopeptide (TPR) repeat protein
LPPPAPRACFGRDELIEEIVGLAENLEPIALIGAGGIGKTSIALKVLHNNRIKQRFGENRRFIRCDQFPATLPHFLSRLSKVTGAGVENPEDLTPLLPFLSSKEILIVLDNAESILDPQGTDAREIYASVEELCQLDTICVCITSRISTIPPDCETFDIPTLSMDAARDVFYRLYRSRGRSDLVDGVLKQLEFHPLSVTLLATVAQQNRWGMERLIKEWEGRRTDTLRTEHQTSLGATIELSLASPMFKELGPDARGLLGVVAFYPQGVDENNIDWLFPTISDRTRIFDKFCILSLTYRSNGFITMLAPLRDHLRPKDPMSSPLLCTTKELGCYEEGIHQAREALEIYERLGVTVGRARCLKALARLLRGDGQLDAAEEAIIKSINLLPEKGEEDEACRSHRVLGDICRSKGEKKKAIYHYEVALGIASTFDWRPSLFRIHLSLALLFLDEDELDDAQVHTERAKSQALDNTFYLGRAIHLQAVIWYRQQRLEDAASEALHAKEIFKKLGSSQLLEICNGLLQDIEGAKEGLPPSVESNCNCERLGTIVCPAFSDLLFSPRHIVQH